jgi:predicted component of type VI protein secretion system
VNIALQTDKGIVPATALVESLRDKAILLPALRVIERVCSEAITWANPRPLRDALGQPVARTSLHARCSAQASGGQDDHHDGVAAAPRSSPLVDKHQAIACNWGPVLPKLFDI